MTLSGAISNGIKGLKNALINAKTNVLKTLCVIYFFAIMVLIPNQIYTIIFIGAMFFFASYLVGKFYTMYYFQYHDFETASTAIRQMSMHEFSAYRIVDRLGEPFFNKYAFRAGKDTVFEVDSIDDDKKIIKVNPIHTNLDVIKFAQSSAEEYAINNNALFNKVMAYETDMDYMVLREVKEKLDSNKVMKAIRGEKVYTMKEERIMKHKEEIKRIQEEEKAKKLEDKVMLNISTNTGGNKI